MGVTSRAIGRSRTEPTTITPATDGPDPARRLARAEARVEMAYITAVRAPARIGDTGRSWRGWVQPGPTGRSGWANRSATARQRSKAGSATSLASALGLDRIPAQGSAPDPPAGQEAGCAGQTGQSDLLDEGIDAGPGAEQDPRRIGAGGCQRPAGVGRSGLVGGGQVEHRKGHLEEVGTKWLKASRPRPRPGPGRRRHSRPAARSTSDRRRARSPAAVRIGGRPRRPH